MANNISINISANTASAVSGIQNVNNGLQKLVVQFQTAKSACERLAMGLTVISQVYMTASIVVEKITAAVRATVDAYSAQEQAEIRLQTTLKATQNAVGMSASELLDLADSLQKVTAYSDQEIIAVEGILAATRKIGRDVMPEATKAVLNMAAATGEDATQVAERLAKALADPAGEIESLK